jgi:hypothetical protein
MIIDENIIDHHAGQGDVVNDGMIFRLDSA